jgi:hypothetical protein
MDVYERSWAWLSEVIINTSRSSLRLASFKWAELISSETRLWAAQTQTLIRRCCRDDRGRLAGLACPTNHQGTFQAKLSNLGLALRQTLQFGGTDHKHLLTSLLYDPFNIARSTLVCFPPFRGTVGHRN